MAKKLYHLIAVLLSCCCLVACQNKEAVEEDKVEVVEVQSDTLEIQEPEPPLPPIDTIPAFEHVMERGALVAVTNCSDFNYKMYKARPVGFEFDLLKDFCKMHQLRLEMRINDNLDSCFALLNSGKVDVVATGVGLTIDLRKQYGLTNPLFSQKSVLVQRLPKSGSASAAGKGLLRSPLELAGKTVHVTAGSHAVKMLEFLSDEIGNTIYVVENDTLNDLELIKSVSDGRIDYVVVDEYMALAGSYGLTGLDAKLAVGVEHPIGWVVKQREADSSLQMAFNDWIAKSEPKVLKLAMTRYVKNRKLFAKKPGEGHVRISPYDNAIRRTAAKIGWDWRLLAALIYQESRFKTNLESNKGAYGLMQLMPSVMKRYNVSYNSTPEQQLEAGGKLIRFLDKALKDKVVDSLERTKFVLAAYNAGLGHVLDAQRLAEKYEKAPDIWDNNVDFFILNKSKPLYYRDACCKCGFLRGVQTYRFVEDIIERYHHYQNFIE